jgi:hypothetical protein
VKKRTRDGFWGRLYTGLGSSNRKAAPEWQYILLPNEHVTKDKTDIFPGIAVSTGTIVLPLIDTLESVP